MTEIKLRDVPTGTEFTYKDTVYVKIDPVKISCCKSHVAYFKDNPAQKISLPLSITVLIND